MDDVEELLEIEAQERRQAQSRCEQCATTSLYQAMERDFGAWVCFACSKKPEYRLMSKTRAKDEFLLTDKDLEGLRFIEKENHMRQSWGKTKLYMTRDVQRRAVAKHGTLETMEKEKEERGVRQLQIRSKKKREEQRKRKHEEDLEQLAEIRAKEALDTQTHEHTYDDAKRVCLDKGADMYANTCLKCGQRIEFEEF